METKSAAIIGILLVIGVVFLVRSGKTAGGANDDGSPGNGGPYDDFAKCLSEKGVKMYGSSLCPHCNNQKALFGTGWKFVNYVECATTTPAGEAACRSAGILAYPTWVFGDGTRAEGEQSIGQLGAKSGCSIRKW